MGDNLGPGRKCVCTVAQSWAGDPLLAKFSQGPFILACQNDLRTKKLPRSSSHNSP